MYDPIDEQDVYLETQRLAVMATIGIEDAMRVAGLRRSEIAEKLGVPRSRVSHALDGETNMTLKTLAQFGLACGVRWQFIGVRADDASKIVVAPPSLDLGCSGEFDATPSTRFADSNGVTTAENHRRTSDSESYGLAA